MIAIEELRTYTGYLALAVLIFALITYKSYSKTNAKYFIFSLVYAVITEFVSLHFQSLGKWYSNIFGATNYPIANIFIVVQISFYLWWLRRILTKTSRKRMISLFLMIYLAISTVNAFYGQAFANGLQSYTYGIGVIFLIIAISFYFIESFAKETIFNVTDNLNFWLILGVLLFYGTFMPFFFAFQIFIFEDQNILSVVTFGLNFVMYLCFSIGYYKSYKQYKKARELE